MARILIVEDDPGISYFLSEALQASGHTTLLALDGKAGIGLAQRQHPELVIMDLNLPGIDGAAAIRALKTADDTSAMRIIAMSAGSNLLAQSGDLLADAVVGKPFELDELLAEVIVQLHHVATINGAGAAG
jgi:DNA-binding response OmpR family regulator